MEKALNDNVIVVGTSGTGKTYSFVEPNILQGNTNYVVADAKGDILTDTGASLKKMGYKIQVINLVDLQHSNTYNPLAYLNDPLDYLQFADQVITSDVTGFHSAKDSRQDPFWDTAAETLLQALIYFVKEFLPEDQQNMGNVNQLFNLLDTPAENIGDALTILKQNKLDFEYRFDPRKAPSSLYDQEYITIGGLLFEWALQENPASQAVKMWHSIVGILGVNLTRYALADVKNLTSGNEIDFNSLLQPKTVLLILYDDADSSKNFISNNLYDQLFSFLFHTSRKTGNKLPVKVRFFLDDFSNLHIPDFPKKLATARSRNISICMMLQDEGQLKAMFGAPLAETVISNCQSYLLTRTNSLVQSKQSAERFAPMSARDIRLMHNYFLLETGGRIVRVERSDYHNSPNYINASYDIAKHFTTSSLQKSEGLIKILKSLPGVYKVGYSEPQDNDFGVLFKD